jgi:3-oxoadipate enol-lactonase
MAYTDDGTGTPLVLLHGFPFDGRMWREQAAEFSKTHRVILPDFCGFGQSASDSQFTMESLADDVHSLLSGINALPCILGGLSMGGYVAMAFARKYPADLKGLIFLDTKSAGDDEKAREGRQKMIDTIRTGGAKAVADQMLPKLVAPGALERRPELEKTLRPIIESQPPKTLENAIIALRDRPDSTSALASIAVPTLIIVGDGDAITPPAVAEAMQREIKGSKRAVIRGAGHMSPVEQPAQVNQAIRRFL